MSHSMAFLSRHIGSLPGELGSSDTQVNSFFPCRIVRILSPSIAMIVASREIAEGPADIALAMCSASVFGLCPCAFAAVESARKAQRGVLMKCNEFAIVSPLLIVALQASLEERTTTSDMAA